MTVPDEPSSGAVLTEAERRDQRLDRWNRAMAPFIVVAALLPLLMAIGRADQGDDPAIWVDLAAWAVFAADLGVHMWLRPGYLKTHDGKIDLAIVIVTIPWYAIPGLEAGAVVTLARLARVARLVKLSKDVGALRRIAIRLGKTGIVAAVLILSCAIVVNAVESPEDGFVDFGASTWWALVTLTTVGYGDIVPVTTAGRVSAGILMLGGIGILALLAGTLAEFFDASDSDSEVDPLSDAPEAPPGGSDADLAHEIRAMRGEVASLRQSVEERG